MARWKLKGCPRCRGDLYIAQDFYGWYEQCLQCAYRADLKELAEFKKQSVSTVGTSGTEVIAISSGE